MKGLFWLVVGLMIGAVFGATIFGWFFEQLGLGWDMILDTFR